MQSIDWMVALVVAAMSFGVAMAALWATAFLNSIKQKAPLFPDEDTVIFLFENGMLVDATDAARMLVRSGRANGSDLDRLVAALHRQFPDLADILRDMDKTQPLLLEATEDPASSRLIASYQGERLRIELHPLSDAAQIKIDRFSLSAMEEELRTLRGSADYAPFLIWQQTADGKIIWANKAYLSVLKMSRPDEAFAAWPPAQLFHPSLMIGETVSDGPRRLSIDTPEGNQWYDLHAAQLADDILFFAIRADAVVKAEVALREFVQTLTKTFAHLPTGLAIFDKRRQLVLFNPALTDLTTLPADFLSSRPTLFAFLDRLREKQMMPEPKDYKTWRQQLSALEAAATDGTYEESWTLPTGQTYSVAGRPHPDGAVAFLFTDITSEISLTRRFRSELEVGQAVVDALDEGIAVFSSSGVLTLSNRAFAQLWEIEPTSTLGEFGIIDASRVWQSNCAPTPIWGDIRDFVDAFGERAEWYAEAHLNDGRQLLCRITPLAGGATLVGFSVDRAQLELAQPDIERASA